MRSEEVAAYQAAAEAVVATELGAQVYGLEIKPVDPTIGIEDWRGRCLRAGGVLEFGTINEIHDYATYAGEVALVDRVRRIGMCKLAHLAGPQLLTGQPDPFADVRKFNAIPTGAIADDPDDEEALLREYFEKSTEALRSRWSLVQALAQRLVTQRSLKAVEIANVLEAKDA